MRHPGPRRNSSGVSPVPEAQLVIDPGARTVNVAISYYARTQLAESPIFVALKSTGRASMAPIRESFGTWERWRLSLIGEVFNLYNNANLVGYSGDLSNAAFGQPTNRASQVFGSGGPRAFQLAMRLTF